MSGSPQFIEIGRVTLAGRAENVRHARHFVADLLGLDWPRFDDVLTLTSEIASNAVRHTASGVGGQFEVTVAVYAAGSQVRVQVADQGGSSVPRPGDADDGDSGLFTSGRGLMIVDVLADRWGHDGDGRGRVVWFEITTKPETETVPQRPATRSRPQAPGTRRRPGRPKVTTEPVTPRCDTNANYRRSQ